MLQNTKGIVLRSVKYGETSFITTVFTEYFGVQSYMIKGVRTAKKASNKAGLLQPATLLELVVHQHPQKTLEHPREFQLSYLYQAIQQDVVKNTIALFSIELLLRLLPEHAPQPELFEFANNYFITLDKSPQQTIANYPLYFIITCGNMLGYELKGNYLPETTHLDLHEGAFTAHPPASAPFMTDVDARTLSELLSAEGIENFASVEMNAAMRSRLLGWYIAFLQQHSQYMGNIRSLSILHTVLHE